MVHLLAIFTFPGIVVHEMSHYWMCQLMKVRVFKIKLFTLSGEGTFGYVLHEEIKSLIKQALISIAPFFFSSAFAIMILLAKQTASTNIYANNFLMWLGLSIAFWAFPSETDASNFYDLNLRELKYNIFSYLLLPFSSFFMLAAFLNRFYLITSFLMVFLIRQIVDNTALTYLNLIK